MINDRQSLPPRVSHSPEGDAIKATTMLFAKCCGHSRVERPKGWAPRDPPGTTGDLGSEDRPDCCGKDSKKETGNREAPGW